MIPKINIDMILSDPMMIVGAVLIVVGAIVFIIALIKFITHRSENFEQPFIIPQEEPAEPVSEPQASSEAAEPEAPSSLGAEKAERAEDKTVMMSAHETDIQIQFDVVVSQLKTLNKKVSEIEDRLENMAPSSPAPEAAKEAAATNNEYSQKLLKLAEHVIILEREVAKLKSTKPPVMPL